MEGQMARKGSKSFMHSRNVWESEFVLQAFTILFFKPISDCANIGVSKFVSNRILVVVFITAFCLRLFAVIRCGLVFSTACVI